MRESHKLVMPQCYEKGKVCPGMCRQESPLQGVQSSPLTLLSSGASTEVSYPVLGIRFRRVTDQKDAVQKGTINMINMSRPGWMGL